MSPIPTDTQIDPEKIAAYCKTSYCLILESGTLELVINIRHDGLSAVFKRHAVECGAFITAYNPRGTIQHADLNQIAHASLKTRVAALELTDIDAFTQTHSGDWPTEHGLFVLGIDLERAKSLGSDLGQDALVWTGPDLTPTLILLR